MVVHWSQTFNNLLLFAEEGQPYWPDQSFKPFLVTTFQLIVHSNHHFVLTVKPWVQRPHWLQVFNPYSAEFLKIYLLL